MKNIEKAKTIHDSFKRLQIMRNKQTSVAMLLFFVLSSATTCSADSLTEDKGCEKRIDTEDLGSHYQVAIFGEKHGTENAPEYFFDVVCNAAKSLQKSGQAILVGLEFLDSEDSQLQKYLHSEGSSEDRLALLARPNWNYPNKDGRESRAMLNLIDNLRLLMRQYPQVKVVPIDPDLYWEKGIPRDKGMASLLNEAVKNTPNSVAIVLVGDFHAMRLSEAGTKRTLVEYLELRTRSYKFVESGGDAWMCTGNQDRPTCGITALSDNSKYGNNITLSLSDVPSIDGYDGAINLGRLRASKPAVAH